MLGKGEKKNLHTVVTLKRRGGQDLLMRGEKLGRKRSFPVYLWETGPADYRRGGYPLSLWGGDVPGRKKGMLLVNICRRTQEVGVKEYLYRQEWEGKVEVRRKKHQGRCLG